MGDKKDYDFFKKNGAFLVLFFVLLFFILGIVFNLGMMSAKTSFINASCSSKIIQSFYSDSWTVYTTIFGIMGIVLGVIFPLYQAKIQGEEFKAEIQKGNVKIKEIEAFIAKSEEKIKEMEIFKSTFEAYLQNLKVQGDQSLESIADALIYIYAERYFDYKKENNLDYKDIRKIIKENNPDFNNEYINRIIDEIERLNKPDETNDPFT